MDVAHQLVHLADLLLAEFGAARHPGHVVGHPGGQLAVLLHHLGYLAGGEGGAGRQLAHFVGHHRKAPSLLPRPCRLDGRVEGQQVGLIGNGTDGRDDGLDAPGLLVELSYEGDGLIHLGGDQRRGIDHGAQQLGTGLGAAQGLLRRAVGEVGRFPGGVVLLNAGRDVAGELDDLHHLAALIPNGVVGGLQPDRLPPAVVAHEEAGLELAAGQLLPESGLLAQEGLIAEDPVMLAHDLVQAIAHGVEEVGVGADDLAARGKLYHGPGAVQRLGERLQVLQPLMAGRHVAGQLHHPGHPALVLHREIARLQPARLPLSVDPLEGAGLRLPLGEAAPELLIVGGAGPAFGAEPAVGLTRQLTRLIPHQAQEEGTRLQDDPLRAEGDGRGTALDPLGETLLFIEPGLTGLQLRLEFVIEHDTPTSLTIRIGTTASPTEGIGTASPDMSI